MKPAPVVLAEEHGLAMFQIDGVFGAVFFLGNGVVRAVIEDDAVLENLADAGSFVVVRRGFEGVIIIITYPFQALTNPRISNWRIILGGINSSLIL